MTKVKEVVFSFEGFEAHIPAEEDKAVKEALAQQAGLTDRYIKIEPAISAAFGAPECYQKKTPQRAALLAYLTSRHPGTPEVEKVEAQREAASAKGDPAVAHELGVRLDYLRAKRNTDVQNAIRAFLRYYLAGKKGQRGEREEKSPRQRAEEFCKSMQRYFKEGSQWPAADQKFARAAHDAIKALLGDGDLRIAAPRSAPEKASGPVKVLTKAEIDALNAA